MAVVTLTKPCVYKEYVIRREAVHSLLVGHSIADVDDVPFLVNGKMTVLHSITGVQGGEAGVSSNGNGYFSTNKGLGVTTLNLQTGGPEKTAFSQYGIV